MKRVIGLSVRVLALDPVPRATGRIRGIATLRDDSFQAQLASMLEHELAVLLVQVLVEQQARRGAPRSA
jgi:hypothetical protein